MLVFGAFFVAWCWKSVLAKPVDSNQQQPHYPALPSHLRRADNQAKAGPKSILLQPAWNPNFRQGPLQNVRSNPNMQSVQRNQVRYPPAKPQLPADYMQQLNEMKIIPNTFKIMEPVRQPIDFNGLNVEKFNQISPKLKPEQEVSVRAYQKSLKELTQVTDNKELKEDDRFQNLPKYQLGSKLASISEELADARPDVSFSLQLGGQEKSDSKNQDSLKISDNLTNLTDQEPRYTVKKPIPQEGEILGFKSSVESPMTKKRQSESGNEKENDSKQKNGSDLVSLASLNELNNTTNEKPNPQTEPAIVPIFAQGTKDITQDTKLGSNKNVNRNDQKIGKQNGNLTNISSLLDELQPLGNEINQLVVDHEDKVGEAVDDLHLLNRAKESAEKTVRPQSFSVSDDQAISKNIKKVISSIAPSVEIDMIKAEGAAESMAENFNPKSFRDGNNSAALAQDTTTDLPQENDVFESQSNFKKNDAKPSFSIFESLSADASKSFDEVDKNEKTVLQLNNLDRDTTLFQEVHLAADIDKTNQRDAGNVKNGVEIESLERMISTTQNISTEYQLKSIDFSLKKDSKQLKQPRSFDKSLKSPRQTDAVADGAVGKDVGLTMKKKKTLFLNERKDIEKTGNRIELKEKHLDPTSEDDKKLSDEIQVPNQGVIVVVQEIKTGDLSESRNFNLAPVFSALKESRHIDRKKQTIQQSRSASKPQNSNNMHSFDSFSYSAFLMFLFFLSSFFILTCLGGWSTIKNICVVFFHKTQGGRLLWTKNGYTILPQSNHKSA